MIWMMNKVVTNNIMIMSPMMEVDAHFTVTDKQVGKVYTHKCETSLRSKTRIIITTITTIILIIITTTTTTTSSTITGTTLAQTVTHELKL